MLEEARKRILSYCLYRDRCCSEVQNKLDGFSLKSEEKSGIMALLIREGFLDEERFTKAFVRGKFYLKKWGRLKIKAHLRMKNIPNDLINSCMDQINEDDYAKTLRGIMETYLSSARKNHDGLVHSLLRKGYELDEIQSIMEELSTS